MVRTVRWLVFASLIGAVLIWGARSGHNDLVAQQRAPVVAMRMFTGPDGLTHLEEMDIPFAQLIKVAGVQFNHVKFSSSAATPATGVFDWHTAPHRRYVVTLSGKAEIEVSGGTNRKFIADPGHILLAEDLTGKGHRYTARPVGPEDWVTMFVEVDQPRPAAPRP